MMHPFPEIIDVIQNFTTCGFREETIGGTDPDCILLLNQFNDPDVQVNNMWRNTLES